MLKRIVDRLQIVALALVVLTIGMLSKAGPIATGAATVDSFGAEVFVANCTRCHGADGQGGIGPSLVSGNLLDRFEDRAATMAFISKGEGEMPDFASRLSAGEIGAVTDFVRKELASQGG